MKIVKTPHNPIPKRYSKELRDLVDDMLSKDPAKRPTTRSILDMPFIEKYMAEFIIEVERRKKTEYIAPALQEQFKPRPLTAKEAMQKRKEEKVKQDIERMNVAVRQASQNYVV